MKKTLVISALFIAVCAIIFAIFRLLGAAPSGSPDVSGGKVNISPDVLIYGWREENRSGVSSEEGLLKEWPEQGLSMIWKNVELLKGHSSVSFGNNTIYITGCDDTNDFLFALDEYGKIKWKTPYGRIWRDSYPESRCTPTVEGERVYVSSGYGDLACIDGISGEIIWSVKASEIYKGTYGSWGIAEALLIDGDKLYFTPGGHETTTIALNKHNGDLIWKTESLGVPPSYISPVLINYNDYKLLVNVTPRYIFGVDVSHGKILWTINHHEALGKKEENDGQILCVTPLFFNDKIFFTGGYDHGSILIALTENGRKASVEWTDTNLDVHHGGVVMVDGYLYGANWLNNNNGNWCCLDARTGEKMWEEKWHSKGSVISAEGLLYIYDERSGNVGLIRPSPEKFDLISSFGIRAGSGPYWSHPVIHNGVLYLRHGEALMAFNIQD
jgi:outer membrane protein assembly factor BamB